MKRLILAGFSVLCLSGCCAQREVIVFAEYRQAVPVQGMPDGAAVLRAEVKLKHDPKATEAKKVEAKTEQAK